MENLTWTELARLIIMVGWPAAERIMNGIRTKQPEVTAEEWNELRAEVNRSFEDYVGPRPEGE